MISLKIHNLKQERSQTDLVGQQNLVYLSQLHVLMEIICKAYFDFGILFVHGLAFD